MLFYHLIANPLCYEGLRSLFILIPKNFPLHHHFCHVRNHKACQIAAFHYPFGHMLRKNVTVCLFPQPFGHILRENVTICSFSHPFGHIFSKNVTENEWSLEYGTHPLPNAGAKCKTHSVIHQRYAPMVQNAQA